MKLFTCFLPFIIVAVVGEWMRKTKRNVETNDIINRFKELTINACFSRCRNNPKCSIFAMDKEIFMGQTADCILLKNHEKQKYVEVKEGNAVVELFVYEVSVKPNCSHIFLDVFIKWCPLNTVRFGRCPGCMVCALEGLHCYRMGGLRKCDYLQKIPTFFVIR